MKDLPNIVDAGFEEIEQNKLDVEKPSSHKPRMLLLYGSLRERSMSRLLIEECARILTAFGCETRIYNPSGLPLPDEVDETLDFEVEEDETVEQDKSEAKVEAKPAESGDADDDGFDLAWLEDEK